MFGYSIGIGQALQQIVPISKLSDTINTVLEDTAENIFTDADSLGALRDPDVRPIAAKLTPGRFQSPASLDLMYRWSPLESSSHIRLVKITSLDASQRQLLQKRDWIDSEESVIATSCPPSEIRCHIFSVDIRDEPRYTAISYTWLEFPRCIPLLVDDDHILHINASLYACLQRLVADGGELVLWIDQICVDQTNETEKTAQIQLMHRIFQTAIRTFIWLGEDDVDSVLAVQTLSEVLPLETLPSDSSGASLAASRAERMLKDGLRDSSSSVHKKRLAVGKLLNRPWFERAWIYQEAALSSQAVVLIGPRKLDFGRLSTAVRAFCEVEQEKIRYFDQSLTTKTRGYGTLQTIEAYRRSRALKASGTNEEFISLLCRLGGTVMATDKRDLVYAFLAFQDQSNRIIKSDYTCTVTQAYNSVARALINYMKSLDILGLAANTGGLEGLCSWAPNWTKRLPQGFPIYQVATNASFQACRGREHVFESVRDTSPLLVVKGQVIDTVSIVSAHGFSLDDRNKGSVDVFLKRQAHLNFFRTTHPHKDMSHSSDRGVKNNTNEPGSSQAPFPDMEGDSTIQLKRLLKVMVADNALVLDAPSATGGATTSSAQIAFSEANFSDFTAVLKDDDSLRRNNRRIPNFDDLRRKRDFFRHNVLICVRKRVFHGVKPALGLAPEAVRAGDRVCILHGSRVPVILRKVKSENDEDAVYKVIGQCYYEGAMYGEMMNWEEDDASTFRLC